MSLVRTGLLCPRLEQTSCVPGYISLPVSLVRAGLQCPWLEQSPVSLIRAYFLGCRHWLWDQGTGKLICLGSSWRSRPEGQWGSSRTGQIQCLLGSMRVPAGVLGYGRGVESGNSHALVMNIIYLERNFKK